MKHLIIATIAFFLLGCSAPTAQYKAPDVTLIETPKTGTLTTLRLGETMLEKGMAVTQNTFRVDAEIEITGVNLAPAEWKQTGTWNGHSTFSTDHPLGGFVSPIANSVLVYIDSETGEMCVSGFAGITSCSGYYPKVAAETQNEVNSFQQTLIYTGKVGDKIRFSYREFKGEMARDAFTVDVEYDLSESTTVGYKGALIEIIEATNQQLTYKVIKHF